MSQRKQLSIKKWGRTVTILDGEAGIQNPADSLNVKLSGFTYKPRNGYSEVGATPGGTFACLGLDHVINGSGAEEFIGVENRAGTVRAYSYPVDDLTPRTALGSLTLGTGNWYTTYFGDAAYLINPTGTKRVYKHTIGGSDLVVLEDTAYSASPDVDLTVTPTSLSQRGWAAGDTWTYTSTNGILAGATFNAASGVVTVVASDNDNGKKHRTQFQSVLASTQDWSAYQHIAFNVFSLAPGGGTVGEGAGFDIFNSFEVTNTSPEIKTNGTWRVVAAADFKETVSSTRDGVTIEIFMRNITSPTLVEAVRFTVGGSVNRFGSPNACTIYPVKLGGCYLESTLAAHRLWDGTLDGNGITYGVRYKEAGPVYSNFFQDSITADEAYGFSPSTANNAATLGGRIFLSVPVATTGAYTLVEFVRLMADNTTWKIIGTVANSGVPQLQDPYSEYELTALTTATGITDAPIQPTPPFSTAGVVYAFPFKQSMIWLASGGEANIHISRVGDPEEIYDSEVTYDADDLTQPADRTLADNQADQPVWGVQAGANAFICGSRAAYALSGDFPVSLSPSRQIPGSRGIVGIYAGCRFRPTGGTDGAAYLDNDGNVWLVNSVPQFTDDTRAKPHELSSPVRHKIKDFLYTDQRAEFPTLSFADTLLEYQEATSSLWCILGRRAAVYRQDEMGSGWEFYQYSLASTGTETACRDYTNGTGTPSSVARTSGLAWTLPSYGGLDDTNYATCSLTFPTLTELLRSSGIAPVPLLPVSATVTAMHVKIRHWKVGDIPVTHDWMKLTTSGAPVGSNLSAAGLLNDTETVLTYDLTSSLPTLANINAGNVGFELGYTAEQANAAALTGSNFNVVVTNSTSATMTVTATYTGGGTNPSFVYVNITSRITVNGQTNPPATPSADPEMYAEGDNGLTGGTATGTIYPTATPLVVETTERVKITLTAGTGATNVVRYGTAECLPGTVNWISDVSYTGSAAFSSYVPSVVYVDSMEVSYCFSVTSSVTSGVSWQRGAFTVDSKNILARSTGELDIIEYDFRDGTYIEGDGRDGGRSMPDWYITLERLTFEGATSRLNGVQVNTLSASDTFTASARINDGSYSAGTSTGASTSRWVRFPVTQLGLSHQVKISGDETTSGVDGVAIEYQPTSRSKIN